VNEPPVEPGPVEPGAVEPGDDELDGLLRQAFSLASVPGAPETLRASLERLPGTVARPGAGGRWSAAVGLPVAVVFVVVLLVVGAVLAGRRPDPAGSVPIAGSASPTVSPSAGSAAATGSVASELAGVPWVDATPPVAASPTPRPVPAGTRACTPTDLTATAGWQGATGSMAGGIGVTNVSSTACVLDGPPRGVVIRAGTKALATAYTADEHASLGGAPPPGPGLLEPGDAGGWWLVWMNWCGPNLVPTSIDVTLPDGSGPVVAVPDAAVSGAMNGTPRCDVRGSPSTLAVTAFEYRPPEPPLVEPQPASATISAPATATVGQDVAFTVTLTNLGDRAAIFDPCPTYSEDLIVAGRRLKPPADREYALNCPAIGSTLAPGASIVLEMRYPIPDTVAPGPAELLWSLDPGGPFDTGAFGRVAIDIVSAPTP
jgi:hypothetical protein